MIELPLLFTKDNPTFPYNRTAALQRTKMELQKLRKRKPKEFQSALDKFAKNINMKQPRFILVPYHQRHNTNGYAYWIPLFSVWQKEKSRIVFDSAARTQKTCINDTTRALPKGFSGSRQCLKTEKCEKTQIITRVA